MSDDVSKPDTALIVRPRTLPTTAQFEIETQLAWKLRNARGFLPNHFMVGDDNERSAKILAAIEYARAVGIEPMIALQNTQVIDGKVGASALLIGALLRKAGYSITDDTNDVRSIVTVSKNGAAVKGEFSMQDAQRAKLIKDGSGWQKYPRDMMYARALTQAARRGAQDAVLGMAYTAEELGGIEEEIAGVPALGPVIDQAPGVSEAGSLPAAIQPTPPAPSVEVPPPVAHAGGADEQPQAAQGHVETAAAPGDKSIGNPESSVSATTPPPPQTSPARAARSVGPRARRTNVVTVEQGPTTPVAVPEPDPSPVVSAEPVPSQSAPAGLTDEPDDGRAVYLTQQRQLLRESAAVLARLNAIVKNHLVHPLKNEPIEDIPPATPSAQSDASLQALIERDFAGKTLETLDESELQNRLELIEPVIAKRREQLKEKGIAEE